MQTYTGTDVIITYPSGGYIYTADRSVIYIKNQSNSVDVTATITITDANNNTVATMPYVISPSAEAIADLTDFARVLSVGAGYANTIFNVGITTTNDSLTITDTIIAGVKALYPQTPPSRLIFDGQIEAVLDFGAVTTANMQFLLGGAWSTAVPLSVSGTEPTARLMQINQNWSNTSKAVRVTDANNEVLWYATLIRYVDICPLQQVALLRWRADQYAKFKRYYFYIAGSERKITETASLMFESDVYTENNGQYPNQLKRWQQVLTLETEELSQEEMQYFTDLFTSNDVRISSDALGNYGGGGWRVAIDGKSLKTQMRYKRGKLQFSVIVSNFGGY